MAVVGEVLAGRYALGDVLGAGGSGVVRRARDTLLDRDVAVKFLRAGQDDDVLRARLQAEARLAGSLLTASAARPARAPSGPGGRSPAPG